MHMQGVRIHELFLLTPLREGRHDPQEAKAAPIKFLLTPLREGRRPRVR